MKFHMEQNARRGVILHARILLGIPSLWRYGETRHFAPENILAV